MDQRSGDASPLQLATGNLVRKAVGQGVDPKLGEKPHDLAAVVAGPTWRTDQAQRQRNVLKEGQFGQEPELITNFRGTADATVMFTPDKAPLRVADAPVEAAPRGGHADGDASQRR